jgi:hypothetical protein
VPSASVLFDQAHLLSLPCLLVLVLVLLVSWWLLLGTVLPERTAFVAAPVATPVKVAEKPTVIAAGQAQQATDAPVGTSIAHLVCSPLAGRCRRNHTCIPCPLSRPACPC